MANTAKEWFIVCRPWSLTAAIIPVAIGSVYAIGQEDFKVLAFILALIGGMSVQIGANLVNTYADYENGIDDEISAHTVQELVSGKMQTKQVKLAAFLAFAITGIIGIILTYMTGYELLYFGLIGMIGSYCYTGGIFPYKYFALGPIMVFILMGPLMTMPSYFIQNGQISLNAALVSLPVAFLTTVILLGNELRDIEYDKEAGIYTLSMLLGRKNGCIFYLILCALAYLSLILLVGFSIVTPFALLPLILLPNLYSISKILLSFEQEKLMWLSRISGKFHMKFGLLYLLGLFLGHVVFA